MVLLEVWFVCYVGCLIECVLEVSNLVLVLGGVVGDDCY